MARKKPAIKPGDKFGLLFVVEQAEDHISKDGKHRNQWNCKCICGNSKVVTQPYLMRWLKDTRRACSCGCINGERRKKHGASRTTLYKKWASMKSRCSNSKTTGFENYGGKGIKVCQEWQSFDAFYCWAKQSGYKKGLTIDRINVDGDYCPENCRWIPGEYQADNRRNTIKIHAWNECKTLTEWSRDQRCIVSRLNLKARLGRGWSPERAMTTPAGEKFRSSS